MHYLLYSFSFCKQYLGLFIPSYTEHSYPTFLFLFIAAMTLHKADSPGSGSLKEDDLKSPHSLEDGAEPDSVAGQTYRTAAVVDHVAERALCRKFDFRLLPVLAIMYLFNALDKGNLGNAKTAGLEKDLGFKNNQYNIILSVFYVPYVLFAPILVCSTQGKS